MKPAAAVLLALVSAASLQAGWVVRTSEYITTPVQGVEVRRAVAVNDAKIVTLTAVIFSERLQTLRVIDSPPPGHSRLQDVMKSAGAIAGVNGGYFQDNLDPVGLLVSDGTTIHPFQRAKLLSGVLTVRKGRIDIVRANRFETGGGLTQAIQCGPMLVEAGTPVSGLDRLRSARRTVVATDGRGRWLLAYFTSTTLSDTAWILAAPDLFPDWKTRTALNLDGGGSSGLWVRAQPAPISLPEFSRVRNYLGVFQR